MKSILWHYTVGTRWSSISKDGLIKVASAWVPLGERCCVWFTFGESFEPTARKGIIEHGVRRGATLAETEMYGLGLYRIGVAPESAPHNVAAWKRLSGTTQGAVLVSTAKAAGADPRLWRVSFDPVPREKWLRVERWDGA